MYGANYVPVLFQILYRTLWAPLLGSMQFLRSASRKRVQRRGWTNAIWWGLQPEGEDLAAQWEFLRFPWNVLTFRGHSIAIWSTRWPLNVHLMALWSERMGCSALLWSLCDMDKRESGALRYGPPGLPCVDWSTHRPLSYQDGCQRPAGCSLHRPLSLICHHCTDVLGTSWTAWFP